VKNTWRWLACGKHPSLKDYFKVGEELPMGAAFSDWVAKGYQNMPAKKFSLSDLVSLRFWTGGPTKGSFVCGVVRDSCDSIGRPFPLLVLGTGPLRDWEGQWQALPYACERTWGQMEGISTRRYPDLKQLEEEVRGIKAPEADWDRYAEVLQSTGALGSTSSSGQEAIDIEALEKQARAMTNNSEIFVSIEEYQLQNHLKVIGVWLSLLKRSLTDIPKTVFMGGNQLRTFVAMFRRPLMAQDFTRIWHACAGDRGQ
jgi:type VI secretion system protein VasJ